MQKHFIIYLVLFFGVAITLLGIVSATNYIVDPYQAFRSGNILHLTKTENRGRARDFKARAIKATKPNLIFLGSSRTEEGMDPSHPLLRGQSAYNSGLNAGRIFEMRKYFEHAVAQGNVKDVIIGLDFFSFNMSKATHDGYDETLLDDLSGQEGRAAALDYKILLSLDTFISSIKTLTKQSRLKNYGYYADDGQRLKMGVNLGLTYDKNGKNHYALFKNWLKRFTRDDDLLNNYKTRADNGTFYMDDFAFILSESYKRDIKLSAYITPVHALHLEAIFQKSEWETFENWKRDLIQTNEKLAKNYNATPFAIWDFTGHTTITTEAVPKDPLVPMAYYWEGAHFKKDPVGHTILETLQSGTPKIKDLGTRLQSDMIDNHLEKIAKGRATYYQNNEKLIKDIIAP